MPAFTPPQRRYDKGRDRWKHVGKDSRPQITFDNAEPRKWIGKCPNEKAIPDQLKTLLLNEAIPARQGDRNVDYAKTLFVVHDGAIYAAQTSDGGVTYHGYPYKGKIAGDVMARLELMAVEKDCEKEFRKWVKSHIMRHGERRGLR
jgi:hypothetical protein